jgi:DNA repair protein RecO (recombination protein O)
MGSFKTEGVILKRTNVGEADRFLTIFTRDYGKIHAIARGVRRIISRRGGNVEIFTCATMFFAVGRNFDVLTEAETTHSFQALRKNLTAVAYAYEICELVDKLTAEKQEHRDLYKLLVEALEELNSNRNISPNTIKEFEQALLKILGFWPKDKPVDNIDIEGFIESIIERELKSKNFLLKLNRSHT